MRASFFVMNIFGAAMLMAFFVFAASGCGIKKNGEESLNNRSSNAPLVEDNVFNSIVEASLSQATLREAYPRLKTVFEKVFEGVKLTGFLASMEAIDGGETAEYTLKRKITNQDLSLLLEAFSQDGYKKEFSVEQDGVVSFGVYDTSFSFAVSYEIGDSKIVVVVDRAQEGENE